MYDKISSNCQKLHINQAIATDYLVTTPDALISDILKVWQPSNLGCEEVYIRKLKSTNPDKLLDGKHWFKRVKSRAGLR